MAPPSTNSSSGRDRDDVVILVVDASVAGKVAVVDVLDRVVAAGGTDTLQLALISAIDTELLEDGVARGQTGQGGDEGDGDLHYY